MVKVISTVSTMEGFPSAETDEMDVEKMAVAGLAIVA